MFLGWGIAVFFNLFPLFLPYFLWPLRLVHLPFTKVLEYFHFLLISNICPWVESLKVKLGKRNGRCIESKRADVVQEREDKSWQEISVNWEEETGHIGRQRSHRTRWDFTDQQGKLLEQVTDEMGKSIDFITWYKFKHWTKQTFF